ncbi:MAG: acylneuraminate cytidylyltransferase family protein [Nitratireductor sp.]|nr:acylneuraminate cytidylyltransferase family protein [Nitratireductor sp.]
MALRRLAVIPARGGSKGIPRKNIRAFCGKPLIVWTIEAALEAKGLNRVVVSSDDEEIMEISKAAGADVPFVRPSEIARDDTPGIDPVLHATEMLQGFDEIMLLQPTSPLRNGSDIEAVIALKHESGAPAAVSLTAANHPPFWMYGLDSNARMVPFGNDPAPSRRQDAPQAYYLNGAVYLADTQWLKGTRSFLSDETVGYIMPQERSVDIDSPLDWKFAEFMMKETRLG